MPDTLSAPLVRLPGRTVLLDPHAYPGDIDVTHEGGSAIICLSRLAPAPGMPDTNVDPIGRCRELDHLLPEVLTLRPPTPTTAWLRVTAGLMVGLCLCTGDVYVHLPVADIQGSWWDDIYEIWEICRPYARRTSTDEFGLVVRGSGTPELHDWWWSLAPKWLHADTRGRYCIPGVVSEDTAGAALWATIGQAHNFVWPICDLNEITFTPDVQVREQWEYGHHRLQLWCDEVVTRTDQDDALVGFEPPAYLAFVLPRLHPETEPRKIHRLDKVPVQS